MKGKYILVPYDVYKNINSPTVPASELDRTKEKMSEILEDKHLDDSTKNILYNQELLNYIRQRKELADKPIRVQAVYKTVKPPDYVETLYPAYPYAGQTKDDDDVTTQLFHSATVTGTPSSQSQFTPVSIAVKATPKKESPKETPKRRPHERDYIEFEQPTPSRNKEKEASLLMQIQKREMEEELEKRISKLASNIYSQVLERPGKFGVIENGQIINNNNRRPYGNSEDEDAKFAIMRILGSQKAHSPAGFAAFRRRLMTDNNIKDEIDRALDDINQFRRRVRGEGEGSSRNMRGFGIFASASKRNGRFLYKPERWNY